MRQKDKIHLSRMLFRIDCEIKGIYGSLARIGKLAIHHDACSSYIQGFHGSIALDC